MKTCILSNLRPLLRAFYPFLIAFAVLSNPVGLALLGNKLFVSNFVNGINGTVGEYDARTGAAINANFITGLADVEGIAVKSAK